MVGRTGVRKQAAAKTVLDAKNPETLGCYSARMRRQWHHERTNIIAGKFGTVCLEDLKILNMTASARGTAENPGHKVRQKAGLNRSILEQGWHQFETLISYKIEAQGGRIIKVDPINTSRKCRKCHCASHRNREKQAIFRCTACGHEEHADVRAAKNILGAGTRPSGHKQSPRIPRRTSRREKIPSF
jgi:putative transposase